MTQTLSNYGIGASEISSVCGLNPYASPWDVYLRKTGQAPETEYSEPMEWGHRLEPAIRQKYVDDTKETVYVPSDSLFHPDAAWARATPDGIVLHAASNTGLTHTTWKHLLQCKNVGYWVEKAWRDAPPEYVQLQEQWEMYVTGLARADIACLIAGNDFRVYTVHGSRAFTCACEPVLCSLCSDVATRMSGDEPTCAPCGALVDADVAEYQASLCSAGQDHEAAKRNEALWQTFEYVGQHSDEVETIEMRNCRCGSTLGRVIATVTERQDGAGRVTYQREVA